MKPDSTLSYKRTLLPLAGIVLSLGTLLFVPIVVDRQTRELRNEILDRRIPVMTAVSSFRSSTAEEIAATRFGLATGDPAAVERVEEAASERRRELARLLAAGSTLDRVGSAYLDAIRSNLAVLDEARESGEPMDTAVLRARWDAVTTATNGLEDALATEIAAARAEIDAIERMGLVLTFLLTFIALTSAMVTARMDLRLRAFARESERSRREQQILLQSSGEGVFGVDTLGRCTFLNPAGSRLIGYREEEVLGQDLRLLLLQDPASPAFSEEFLRTRGFAGGELGSAEETTLVCKDGTTIEAECLTSPILEKDEVRGAVITIRNISQRKAVERERLARLRTEQMLRENAEAAERRARFLAEASELFASSLDIDTTLNSLASLVVPRIADSCIIYLVDEQGAIQRLKPVHVDPERQRILAEQLDRYPPRLETLIPPVRQALIEGRPSLVPSVSAAEMKGVPGDASHHSVIPTVGLESLIVVPLRARGRIVGAISYGVADSGRTYTPEDLALAEDLATRAAMALDNARLYQQSQEAVMARNEVLGIVSHDLRNPLNAVRFGAQALLRHWPPLGDGEVERNQLVAITKAADRMHRLIRDLLDLAQIDARRLAIEPVPLPASILMEDAAELVHAAAVERNVAIRVERRQDLPVIHVDGERILQVFSNLLHNAIKFSPAGSEVFVRAEPRRNEVVFSVQDHGRGIEPDHIGRIFDRFWKSKKGSGEGAGLGLAIARGIVESHGGRIWVESTPGVGSTFYFALPAGGDERQAPDPELSASAAPA